MINFLWTFVVFSFLGWCLEEIHYIITEKKIANCGFLMLPFSPMYGFGALLIDLAFSGIINIPILILVGSILMLGTLKFLSGLIFDKVFKLKLWDYSKLPFNIKGYVNIPTTIVWGFVSLILVQLVLPILKAFCATIPDLTSYIITLSLVLVMIIDSIMSFATIHQIKKQLKEMDDVSKLIENSDSDNNDKEKDTLKAEYETLVSTNHIFRRKIVTAFPDIHTDSYAEQFDILKAKLSDIKVKNLEEYERVYENKEDKPFAFGLNFTKLFWLFVIGSLFGTILETGWAFAEYGHFEYRVGLVYGPFIPVYGGGAVLITLGLYKLYKASDIIIYIASGIIGAGFEFFCSYFQEMFFGTVSWDYSDTLFNLDGRTNLMFALIWGFLGLIWVRYLYPLCSKMIEKIPKKIGNLATIALVVFMLFDSFMTCAALQRADERANDIPATNVFAEYLDEHLDDDYLSMIFPHMTNVETGINVGQSTPDEISK